MTERALWRMCEPLRDLGLPQHAYIEQLCVLLWLHRVDAQGGAVPGAGIWPHLSRGDPGDGCVVWRGLGRPGGPRELLGFEPASLSPAALRGLARSVEALPQDLSLDVAFEQLLHRTAQDVRSGVGQYFTPRVVVDAIVSACGVGPGDRVLDPAAGTGGFLRAAARRGGQGTRCVGVELVEITRRVAVLCGCLAGVSLEVRAGDALEMDLPKSDLVVTNPPFGLGQPVSRGLPVDTRRKGLAFLQRALDAVVPGGQAAVVLPDTALTAMGQAGRVRAWAGERFDLVGVIRLPLGAFYARRVRACVVMLQRRPGPRAVDHALLFDLRAVVPRVGRRRPLVAADLRPFLGGLEGGEGLGRGGHLRRISAGKIADAGQWWIADQGRPPPPPGDAAQAARDAAASLRQAQLEIAALQRVLKEGPRSC